MDSVNFAEYFRDCIAARKEYEISGGFTPNKWDEYDSVRYRMDIKDIVERAFTLALEALYEYEIGHSAMVIPEGAEEAYRRFVVEDVTYYNTSDQLFVKLVNNLFNGTLNNLAEIDVILEKHLTCGWKIERLAHVERNLLHLGIFALLKGVENVEADSVIRSCSKIARDYSGLASRDLIYGILCEVHKDLVGNKSENSGSRDSNDESDESDKVEQ